MAHHKLKLVPGDSVTIEIDKDPNRYELLVVKEQRKELMSFREIQIINNEIGINLNDICNKGRKMNLVFARFYISHILCERYKITPKVVGRMINHDRTSVLYYKKQHKLCFETNYDEYVRFVSHIEKLLNHEEDKA